MGTYSVTVVQQKLAKREDPISLIRTKVFALSHSSVLTFSI